MGSGYGRTSAAPASRDSFSFASLDTVVMTLTPRYVAHWVSSRPMPPAPACTSTVSPAATG
ncbi:Uncharacterised protein [Mycobacteroides abscessus subsp. abscessus]|nr:Uncharacterised protein [Mycobacteroides abscessus subsp. abscessus]SLC93765.1 Uncharacterised protein [Mycobacteroides abscessus subsp. massiliense]